MYIGHRMYVTSCFQAYCSIAIASLLFRYLRWIHLRLTLLFLHFLESCIALLQIFQVWRLQEYGEAVAEHCLRICLGCVDDIMYLSMTLQCRDVGLCRREFCDLH